MKKGINNYLAGIMLGIVVVAIIIIIYAVTKQDFLDFITTKVNTLKQILGA